LPLTPVEVRHVRFSRRPFGYRRASVEQTLLEVADSFEDVWRSRADLADRVEALEGELVRHKELEALLRTTLVSAAHAEARAVLREATAERERLEREARRVRSLLRSALDAVEQTGDEEAPPAPERWEAA
jgi:DivIVA domain-containing protein